MPLTTKLDAVNTILGALGEAPVNTIENPESADIAGALQTLNEVDRSVQSKGWASFNREYSFPIQPDGTGAIHLPANCLRVDAAYGSESAYKYTKIQQRGLKLYDGEEHTFVFAESLLLDMVLLLDFDDITEPARHYIAIKAARQKQALLPSDAQVDRILEAVELQALATLEQAEDEVADTNQISGNSSVVNAVIGNGVRRRP